MVTASCVECGAEFLKRVKGGNQPRFCSSECRKAVWKKYYASWCSKNRDRVVQRRALIPDKVHEWNKSFYARHKDRRKAQRREYYRTNKERQLLIARQYNASNPNKIRAIGRNSRQVRRARLKGAFVEAVNAAVVFERDKGVCGICSQQVLNDRWEVDHVTALANGGSHSYSNVQLAHLSCNRSKGAKVAS